MRPVVAAQGMICDSAKILSERQALQCASPENTAQHQLSEISSARTMYQCYVAVQPGARRIAVLVRC